MLLTDIAVKRPVFATVVSLLLITFGVISYTRLPLREYPDIDQPIILIRTAYVGASANVVETKITQIIENAVSGLEGLKTISSTSEDGRSAVTLEFHTHYDINEAANDVRDRVSRVARRLPDEADVPMIAKRDASSSTELMIGLVHPTMSQMELTDFADRYLVDRFSVVEGVAAAQIMGEKRYSMRIWLDRKALAARGLTIEDVEMALNAENLELPAGRLESMDMEFPLRVQREYRTPEAFGRLAIRRGQDGYVITLGDVSHIEVAPETLRDSFIADGNNIVGIGISRQSTANTLAMIRGVKEVMAEMQPDLPPGMEMIVLRDSSVFVEAAVREVMISLALAVALVVGIIFLFLGNARAALVPAITVPIALISAMTILYALGFSLNLLTLLGLVLSIGLVVDDSIVVLENIHRRIEDGEPPLLAAYRGAREVAFAVIATTLVLVAVFVPISMMEGDMGKLFTEFAFTIAGAVVCSSLVALTLSAMLCSKFLKPHSSESWLIQSVDAVFETTSKAYVRLLRWIIRVPFVSLFLLLVLCGMVWVLTGRMQSELEPLEDRGVLMLNMTAPEGVTYTAAYDYMQQITERLMPLKESGEANHILTITPGGWNRLGAVNSGRNIIDLSPWNARERSAAQIANALFSELQSIHGVRTNIIQPPGLTRHWGQPVQFVIGGSTYEELIAWRDTVLERANAWPGLQSVDADYRETTPLYYIAIDRMRAAELGVTARSIGRTLETFLGSRQVTTYVEGGEEYDVILQASEEDRRTPSDMQNIYVRSARTGQMIPLTNLVTIEERADANVLNRYNRMRAITISGTPAEGYTIGDCLNFLDQVAREDLPATAIISYKGMSLQFRETSGSILFVFIMAVVVAYLVLAAQFESFVSPFVIMLTLPMGLLGAAIGMLWFGVTMNIFSQIGLVMLIGLAAKNGILIVEFANQLRDRGVDFDTAVFEAARLRLRPVAMTGISTAIGALPLMFTTGAGAISRMALGVVIVFGATAACLLTLFVVPIGYYFLARSQASPRALERKLDQLDADNPQVADA